MTRLLVSVRNQSEAGLALRSGAGLIDVKEPDRGPLGRPDPWVVEEVARAISGTAPVSVALGELDDWIASPWPRFPVGIRYAKLGLAGCSRDPDWLGRWQNALRALPAEVAPVAVVYADWRSAAAPSPADIIEAAVANRCAALLIDTFDKSRGGLLDWLTCQELAALANAMGRRMLLVLAGSLNRETISRVLPLGPDYVAVRGAACRGGRSGAVDGELVRRLADLLAAEWTGK